MPRADRLQRRASRLAAAGLALGALLLLGLPRAAAAQQRLEVSPAELELGAQARVELELVLPTGARAPRLKASRGTLEAPAQVAPGRWRVGYVPPRQLYPQLAVLDVEAEGPTGPLSGWAVLRLHGRGTAEVRTAPRTTVLLHIGPRTFGPVQADAAGLAHVPVVVPPGVGAALFGRREIDLGVPPVPATYAFLDRDTVQADREEEVAVRVYAVDPDGSPHEGALPTLAASRGSVAPLTAVGPGVSVTRWRLPPGPAGQATLEVRGPGEPAPVRLVLEARPGPARRFRLSLDRAQLVAQADARVGVAAEVLDAAGNPTRAALSVGTELTPPVPLVEEGPGRATGVLSVPATIGARQALDVRLYADGAPGPVASQTLALAPAAPARLELLPAAASVVADGTRPVVFRVRVADAFGNPVSGALPEVHSETDAPGPLTAAGPGEYEVRLVPPELQRARQAQVAVRLGALAAEARVALRPARPWLAASVAAGAASDFRGVGAPVLDAQLLAFPGWVGGSLGAALDVGLLGFGRGPTPEVPDFQGSTSLLSVSAQLAWRLQPLRGVEAWAQAGPGLARVQTRSALGGAPAVEEAGAVLLVQAAVGAGWRMGPGLPFAEVRAFWFDDPRLRTLVGALRGAGLTVGYRLDVL